MNWTLTEVQTFADIAQAVITAGAILAAGWWFIFRRTRYPRGQVSHRTHQVPLPDGRTLLRVQARVVNNGEVLLRTPYVRTRVQHFCPLPAHIAADIDASPTPADQEREFPWPVIGAAEWKFEAKHTEVEPGESEQFDADFIIPAEVEQVIVYTYVSNHTKQTRRRDIGWSHTRVVTLDRSHNGRAEADRAPSTPTATSPEAT